MFLYHRGRVAVHVRHGEVSCPARRCALAVSAGARWGARLQSGPDTRATTRRMHARRCRPRQRMLGRRGRMTYPAGTRAASL
ncbi:hypothetical protein BSLA_03f1172 [Burkholderia stabilis]|nr:hypothetical protein BSLA_03f1172 [Burkholderia stabilis]